MIATLESQMQSMKNNLETLKKKKAKVEKKEKKKEKKATAPVASSSKATSKQTKPPAAARKKGKKPITDDDVLSFEQKKDLSDTIGKLEGTKLEKVIQIIHEGVPEIRDVSALVVHRSIVSHVVVVASPEHRGDRARDRSATCECPDEAL